MTFFEAPQGRILLRGLGGKFRSRTQWKLAYLRIKILSRPRNLGNTAGSAPLNRHWLLGCTATIYQSKRSTNPIVSTLNYSVTRITTSDLLVEETNSFEVQLPRWRNHVDVFKDMESELGFVATLRLDRIGMKKNWQRRLGYNYKVLYVKGKKPVWN